MPNSIINNQQFKWHRYEEATHLPNSKGKKTDRMDITNLVIGKKAGEQGLENKGMSNKVNSQYLIALDSKDIREEDANYQPFWSRQVAVKVGNGTGDKIQYAILNRNSLVKRLNLDEATLDMYIEKGKVDEYIGTRLKELENVKSCYVEANPLPNSKGKRQLRLNLAEQFPLDENGTKIKDERNQYCVAMSKIVVTKDDTYCAGWGEIAVRVGKAQIANGDKTAESSQYAILNKNSLLNRLGPATEKERRVLWKELKNAEKLGTVDHLISGLLKNEKKNQGVINQILITLAKGELTTKREIIPFLKKLREVTHFLHKDSQNDTMMTNLVRYANDNKNSDDLLKSITSHLWWNVPTDSLPGLADKFPSPAQIALREPTTISDWDEEGKYTISAVHDFIDTDRPFVSELRARGEVALHCVFEEGEGWVTYKIEDLKRLGFKEDDFIKYQYTDDYNFSMALKERLKEIGTKIIELRRPPEVKEFNNLLLDLNKEFKIIDNKGRLGALERNAIVYKLNSVLIAKDGIPLMEITLENKEKNKLLKVFYLRYNELFALNKNTTEFSGEFLEIVVSNAVMHALYNLINFQEDI